MNNWKKNQERKMKRKKLAKGKKIEEVGKQQQRLVDRG